MEAMVTRPRHRFTVEDYHRMGEAGIFREGDRVELIEGEIVEMPPIGPPHGGTVMRLNHLLSLRLGDACIVAVQSALILSDLSEPEPDVMILRARADYYTTSHPGPGDVLLLIEVADTSIGFDRGVKLPLYARTGIPEYWIVDLNGGLIEVHRSPQGGEYRERREIRPGQRLVPAALPELTLEAAEILGSGAP